MSILKKTKIEDTKKTQEICPETASLWTKLHNVPYLLTRRWALVLYTIFGFIKDVLLFTLILFLVGMFSTDIVIFFQQLVS